MIYVIHYVYLDKLQYTRCVSMCGRYRLQNYLRCPLLSIRLAILTVSPNRQYLGIVVPTTPAAQGPL